MREQLFKQPLFIPIFKDYDCFGGSHVGLTGQRGVLGSILRSRLEANGIRVSCYPGNIKDTQELAVWFAKHKFTHFYHFAAVVPVNVVDQNRLATYETNVIGTYNVCKQVILTQQNAWLFLASTSHVYKACEAMPPQVMRVGISEGAKTFYGKTKLAAESIVIPLLESENINYCIGRIFSFSSYLQKEPYLVPSLRKKIQEANTDAMVKLINPDSIRDIVDAESVIDCLLYLGARRAHGVLNVGSGEGVKIIDIARLIASLENKELVFSGVNVDKPNSLIADIEDLKSVIHCLPRP